MATNKERDAATGQFQKGHKKLGGRPKGAKDTRPRLNISLRSAMQLFVDEDGNLVAEALREGLKDADGRVKVAAVKVALDFYLKSGGARPPGKGLVIVLSSNKDPLAEKSGRPSPVIDLTLSGSAAAAEPRVPDTGARARPTAPALPAGPATKIAEALSRSRPGAEKLPEGAGTAGLETGERRARPGVTTPERFGEVVGNAVRLDATYWQGDCPVCHGRRELTWRASPEGRAADFECARGCPIAEIVAAAKARARAQRAAPKVPPKLPKVLQSEGEDMDMMQEPAFLPEAPHADNELTRAPRAPRRGPCR